MPMEKSAVIWDAEDGTRYWTIGFFVREVDNEHDDVQIVHPMQLLPVEIVGDSATLNSVFIVNNAEEIKKAFEYIIGSQNLSFILPV